MTVYTSNRLEAVKRARRAQVFVMVFLLWEGSRVAGS